MLLVQIRDKPNHRRSEEEKQWVALDLLVNKSLYDSLTTEERDDLHVNEEYKTELGKEDVERILSLPHEIELSLPYLKSRAEVDAHGLLNTYTHERGDAYYAKVDEYSQHVTLSTPPGGTSPPYQLEHSKPVRSDIGEH